MSRVRATGHLPSGSSLPDARAERAVARSELGVEHSLVVATLSSGHPSHLTAYVEAALARLASDGVDVTYFQLGDGSSPVVAPEELRVVAPGRLPAERLAALVAAADIFLAPLIDGVSTRRTSFMTGLCEAVAVVGTKGALTDPLLLHCGLELVEVGSAASFAERVAVVRGRRRAARDRCRRRTRAVRRRVHVGRDRLAPARPGERLMRPVRLLIVAPWGERVGGAEEMLWTILRHLDRTQIQPEVGFLSPGPFVDEIASLGITSWSMPATRLRNPVGDARTVVALARRFRSSRPDVVLAWSAKAHVYVGVAALMARYHGRVLWWQHAIASGHWLERLATVIPAHGVGCSRARLRRRSSI